MSAPVSGDKGILASNTALVSKLQDWIKQHVHYDKAVNKKPYSFHAGICHHDCQLPSITQLRPDMLARYKLLVIDSDMMDDLQAASAVNWHQNLSTLYAVKIPRDGNCLLHSAAFAMWGVDDRREILRQILLMSLQNDFGDQYRARWWQQRLTDMQNLEPSENEVIMREWEDVLRSVANTTSQAASRAVPYKFLESVHIYVLSNILRRPMIIVTDGTARSLNGASLQENDIGGIYLPLEWAPSDCCKTPLIIGYSNTGSHFSPLLSEFQADGMKKQMMFPLMKRDLSLLTIRFLKKEEEAVAWKLLQDFLVIKDLDVSDQQDGSRHLMCVLLSLKPMPFSQNTVEMHYQQFVLQSREKLPAKPAGPQHTQSVEARKPKAKSGCNSPGRSPIGAAAVWLPPPSLSSGTAQISPSLSTTSPHNIEPSSKTEIVPYSQQAIEAHAAQFEYENAKKSRKNLNKTGNERKDLHAVEISKDLTPAVEIGMQLRKMGDECQDLSPTEVSKGLSSLAETGMQLRKLGDKFNKGNYLAFGGCISPKCTKQASMGHGGLCAECFKNFTIAESGTELISVTEGSRKYYITKDPGTAVRTEAHKPEEKKTLTDQGPMQVAAIIPTAPPPSGSFLEDEPAPLSMMSSRCVNGCGYRCSESTYPYCHECYKPQTNTLKPNNAVSQRLGSEGNNTFSNYITQEMDQNEKLMKIHSSEHSEQGRIASQNNNLHQPSTSARLKKTAETISPISTSGEYGKSPNIPKFTSSNHRENVTATTTLPAISSIQAQAGQQVKCSSPYCTQMIQPGEGICHNCREILRKHSSTSAPPFHLEDPYVPNAKNGDITKEAMNRAVGSAAVDNTKGNTSILHIRHDMEKESFESQTYPEKAKERFGFSHIQTPAVIEAASSTFPIASPELPMELSEYGFTHDSYIPMSSNLSPHSVMATSLSRAPEAAQALNQHNLQKLEVAVPSKDTSEPSSQVPTSNVTRTSNSVSSHDNNSYNKMLQALEFECKSNLKKCRTPNCTSYGNKKSSGYCNECHRIYSFQQEELLRAQWGEDVPDCVY